MFPAVPSALGEVRGWGSCRAAGSEVVGPVSLWPSSSTGTRKTLVKSEALLSGPCALLHGILQEMPKKSLTWSFFPHLDASEAVTQWQDQSLSSWQDSKTAHGVVWGFLSALICRCSEHTGCWRDNIAFCTNGSFQVLSTSQQVAPGEAEMKKKNDTWRWERRA